MRELLHTLLGCPKNAPAHTVAARLAPTGPWPCRSQQPHSIQCRCCRSLLGLSRQVHQPIVVPLVVPDTKAKPLGDAKVIVGLGPD
jgi:hypothetical protein